MTFAYDGSKYNGYQKQPKVKTIQGELEKALKKLNAGKTVSLVASGRTDAGVHAYNQRAHFDMKTQITPEKIRMKQVIMWIHRPRPIISLRAGTTARTMMTQRPSIQT